MPAVLDANGYPSCCDLRLQPEAPMSRCGICGNEYDYQGLRALFLANRSPADTTGAKP